MLMRQLIMLLLLCFIQSVHADLPITEVETEKPILKFHLEPSEPKVGQKISLFVQTETSFLNNEIVLEAQLDEATLKLTNTGDQLWSGVIRAYSEVKNHNISINIYVRDLKEATRIRQAISQLRRDIISLTEQIAAEPNPTKKAALEQQKTQKELYLAELEINLDELKVFLKSENQSFSVAPDASNTNYPFIASVAPNSAPTAKRIHVTISGSNFTGATIVRFGGQNSTIISSDASSVTVLAPNFSTIGSKDIELIIPPVGDQLRKNAVLNNSFFVADRAILKNIRPVAVTTGYVRGIWPITAPITLTGSNSYDENGDAFSYEWSFVKVPAGSVFTTGMTLDNSPTPSFTPDKVGIYTVRLRLHETATSDLLTSFYNTVTIEVK